MTASLAADGPDKTAVSMVTDMTITGKPAQFRCGVISDVADKIIGQFSACVARKLGEGESSESAASSASSAGEAVVPVSAAAAQATGGAPAPDGGGCEEPVRLGDLRHRGDLRGRGARRQHVGPRADRGADGVGAGRDREARGRPGAVDERGCGSGGRNLGDGDLGGRGAAVHDDADRGDPDGSSAPGVPRPRAQRRSLTAIDLLDTAGAPVLKRLAPVGAGALFLVLVILLVRRFAGGARRRPASEKPRSRRGAWLSGHARMGPCAPDRTTP